MITMVSTSDNYALILAKFDIQRDLFGNIHSLSIENKEYVNLDKYSGNTRITKIEMKHENVFRIEYE